MGSHPNLSLDDSHNYLRISVVIGLILAICTVSPSMAQDDEDKADRLQIHGFLTQAVATATFSERGPTLLETVLGIPDGDITSDYRFLALQFRYEITDKDVVVVQLSSRSLGDSPINLVEDDIELDWAFYERRIGDSTVLKIGRIQIPLGLYNEIRDVGTILPFYRPPFSFYREGTFTAETVDGLLFHHTFGADSDWPLGIDAYYGEFDLIEIAPFDPTDSPVIANATDVLGAQLWLGTPIFGLRIGAGGQQRDVTEGNEGIVRPVGGTTQFDDWFVSLEYLGGKFSWRSEYREISAGIGGTPVIPFLANAKNTVYYGQAGYSFSEKFSAYLQYEQSDIELESNAFTQTAEQTELQDFGIALNYHFTPNLVLKAEYHDVEQELQNFNPVFLPGGVFLLDPFTLDSDGGNYSILTFSASF